MGWRSAWAGLTNLVRERERQHSASEGCYVASPLPEGGRGVGVRGRALKEKRGGRRARTETCVKGTNVSPLTPAPLPPGPPDRDVRTLSQDEPGGSAANLQTPRAAVLAGVKVQCSQILAMLASLKAKLARGSGLLRASLDSGCASAAF